uniref:Uncharacterized protein n=1 Tax=Megaselia scalaris TaxID=36166 RepID=T1GX10_MEGSC
MESSIVSLSEKSSLRLDHIRSNQNLVIPTILASLVGQQQTSELPSRGLENEAKSRGSYVNGVKTKYILSSRNDANYNALDPNVNMGSHNIEVVLF